MKKVYSGYINQKLNPESFEPYLEEDYHIVINDSGVSLCKSIQEDIEEFGNLLSVRYFISDTEKSIETLEENLIQNLMGIGKAEHEDRYSDWTGYLWTDQELKVGGHDLLAELSNSVGEFLYLEITYNKDIQWTPAALEALKNGDIDNCITACIPGGIEKQEKVGQLTQSALETLPINLNGQEKEFEKMGFIFGEKIDDLFMNVTFPPGWKKIRNDHPLYTSIVDDTGKIRADIFYKAAFYDRRAFARICCECRQSEPDYKHDTGCYYRKD